MLYMENYHFQREKLKWMLSNLLHFIWLDGVFVNSFELNECFKRFYFSQRLPALFSSGNFINRYCEHAMAKLQASNIIYQLYIVFNGFHALLFDHWSATRNTILYYFSPIGILNVRIKSVLLPFFLIIQLRYVFFQCGSFFSYSFDKFQMEPQSKHYVLWLLF